MREPARRGVRRERCRGCREVPALAVRRAAGALPRLPRGTARFAGACRSRFSRACSRSGNRLGEVLGVSALTCGLPRLPPSVAARAARCREVPPSGTHCRGALERLAGALPRSTSSGAACREGAASVAGRYGKACRERCREVRQGLPRACREVRRALPRERSRADIGSVLARHAPDFCSSSQGESRGGARRRKNRAGAT